jgi:hypothetical protein
VAHRIEDFAADLRAAADLVTCREIEALASNAYFGAWSAHVHCRFAERDANRVRDHWRIFAARGSRLHAGGRTPRKAADPINALLNYGYALAETECRLAAITLGLDPGLGIVHTDQKNRDSLALDLLEPLRPVVESHVLQLLAARHFRANEFHETRDGNCRLLAPLTHELAEQLPAYGRTVAQPAETVAHLLASSSPGRIDLATPLSRGNTAAQQVRGQRSANRQPVASTAPARNCRTCGIQLADKTRQLCPTCWPVTRNKIATDRVKAANASLAAMRAAGTDPTNTPTAAAKRSASLSARKREERAWHTADEDESWTRERYEREVLPVFAGVPLSAIRQATGLSISACSRIRAGKLIPHRRHWEPLSSILSP